MSTLLKAFSLMYHDVVPAGEFATSGISGADADIYKLDRVAFIQHLDAVAQVGKVRSCLENWQTGPPPVFLTFDDGGGCSPWIADELSKRGWCGHFFITTDWIGKPGFVTAADLRAMRAGGHVIGSHSASHPLRILALPIEQIDREWNSSVKVLSDILGEPVTTGSVPGGFYSRQVGESAVRAGVKMLFISEPTEVCEPGAGGCLLLGRFFVQQGMPAAAAASFAGGPGMARTKQALAWKVKKTLKALGGDLYIKARVAYFSKTARP